MLIELTDMTDGMIARRFRCVTDFGKLVDPFCDSFARLLVYFTLAATPVAGASALVPLWMPAVLLLRDLAVAFMRTVAASRGLVVAARRSGKWKAIVQGPAAVAIVAVALLRPGSARLAATWLMLAAVTITAWSLVDYLWGNRAVFRAGGGPAAE